MLYYCSLSFSLEDLRFYFKKSSSELKFNLKITPTEIITLNRRVAAASGNDTDNVLHPRLRVILVISFIGAIMLANGIFQNLNNPPNLIENIMIILFVVQLDLRFLQRFITDEKGKTQNINKSINDFYQQKQDISSEINEVLYSKLKIIYFCLKLYILLNFLMYHVPLIIVWMKAAYSKQFIVIFEIYLPWIDPKTAIGYSITMILQTVQVIATRVCYLVGDVNVLTTCLHVVPRSEYLMIKIREVGSNLRLKKVILGRKTCWKSVSSTINPSTSNQIPEAPRSISDQLKDIIKEYNCYNEYIQMAVSKFSLAVFVSLSINAISIALTIVYIRLHSVMIGLTFMINFTYLIINPCIFGSIISYQNEKLLSELCGFPWYELPLKDQKIYLQMLHAFQNTAVLEVPIVGKLNLELCTDIINKVYTFLMYIINFV